MKLTVLQHIQITERKIGALLRRIEGISKKHVELIDYDRETGFIRLGMSFSEKPPRPKSRP